MLRASFISALGIFCVALAVHACCVSGHTIAQRSARETTKPEKPITRTYEELQMPSAASAAASSAWTDQKDWELVAPQNAASLPQWSGNWFNRRQFGSDPFFNSHSSFPSPAKPTFLFSSDRENPFDDIDTQKPGTVTKTSVDDNGNRVITSYSSGPTHWTTQTMMYPSRSWSISGSNFPTLEGFPNFKEVPELVPQATSITPTTNKDAPTVTTTTTMPTPPSQTPLPTLEEFLQSQYGTKRSTTMETPIATTPTPSLEDLLNSLPTPTTPSVTTIRVEDLPVTQVLNKGKAADEAFLQSLPKELRPTTILPTNTIKVENIPRSEAGTSVTSLTKTVNSPNPPTAEDLDPEMRDILQKAHINPQDINPLLGNTITKTRTEPDGRQIVTTYKVERVPVTNSAPTGGNFNSEVFRTVQYSAPQAYSPPYPSAYPWNTYIPNFAGNPFYPGATYPQGSVPAQPAQPAQPVQPALPNAVSNPIDDFLNKLGLNAKQILDNKGELLKTIVDDNGRVLTVSLTLSTIKGVPEETEHEATTPQPIK